MNPHVKSAIASGAFCFVALAGSNLYLALEMRDSVSNVNKQVQELNADVVDLKKQVELVRTAEKVALSDKDMHCLAKNIFHEAGVENKLGKVAVAQVTLNRLKTGKWGRTVCEVVYAKAQFSWTLNKKLRHSMPKGKLWEESVAVAHEFARGVRVTGVGSSNYYHADYIKQPAWAKAMTVAAKVKTHIFYKKA